MSILFATAAVCVIAAVIAPFVFSIFRAIPTDADNA